MENEDLKQSALFLLGCVTLGAGINFSTTLVVLGIGLIALSLVWYSN